jgi:RNA polymerase subunit RPABC4/transcription elongation factor Spt4
MKKGSLRKTLAAQIMLDNADCYKVCLGCESVILYNSTFCPLCDGYRFDENVEQVIKFIKALTKKDNTTILPPDQQF